MFAAERRQQLPVLEAATVLGLVVTAGLGVAIAQVSIPLFAVAEGLFVGQVALAALRWPRAALVGVVLSPILDRYFAPGLLPPSALSLARLLSEALLLFVGAALIAQAASRGTLRAALDHPTVRLAVAFFAVAVLSAAVNGVPPVQAATGIGFTLDAVLLFVMARVVGFRARQAIVAIGALLILVLAAAVITIGQAVLTPHLLGLSALQGRFGELYRLAAFFGDPNVLAAFLSAAIPFALFGSSALATTRGRRVALVTALVLVTALWLSFSRGGWFGVVVGFIIAGLLIDRRAVRTGLLIMAIALVMALVMPRNLLCPSCAEELDLLGSTFGRFDTIGQGNDLRTLFIRNAVPILRDHPLLGVGPGRYGGAVADIFGTPVYETYGTDRLFINPAQRTVDDFWLHLLVESGVIGAALFVAMIVTALRPIVHGARTSSFGRHVALAGTAGAVISLSLNAVTTMLLEANSVAFLFWVMLGIGSLLALPAEAVPRGADA